MAVVIMWLHLNLVAVFELVAVFGFGGRIDKCGCIVNGGCIAIVALL